MECSYQNGQLGSVDGDRAEPGPRFRKSGSLLPGCSIIVLDLQNLRWVADLAVDEAAEDVHVTADHSASSLFSGLGHGAVDVPVTGSGLVGQAVISHLWKKFLPEPDPNKIFKRKIPKIPLFAEIWPTTELKKKSRDWCDRSNSSLEKNFTLNFVHKIRSWFRFWPRCFWWNFLIMMMFFGNTLAPILLTDRWTSWSLVQNSDR